MRGFALVVLFVVGGVGTAGAEKAKAKESAKIYNRAGEQGQVVIKVKEGQVMRIDRKEGRWYKVRVSGRTGWIPRSKVELVQEDEMVRNTRRRPFVDGRGTKRGFNGENAPDDRVGEDATTSNDDDDKKPSGKKPGKDADDDADSDDDDGDKKKPAGKKPEVKKPEPKKPEPKKEVKKPDPEEDGDTDGEEPKAKAGDKDDDSGDEVKDDRPKLHVKKKTVILSEADPDSEESFTAKPETILHKTGNKKGKYVEVETEDGDLGFVLASSLESGGESEDGPSGGPSGPAQIDARARVGVTIIKQGVRTVGGVENAQPDNYDLSTSAATVALGGGYLKPYGKSGYIGGELMFGIAKAIPGVKVDANNTTGITIYDVNLRAMYGHDFHKKSGMMAFARLGFRYYSYQVADVGNLTKNTAKLPSEIVKAPTIGGALSIPRLTDKIGLRFSLDAVVIGASMQQTKGLEDGVDAGMKGADVGIGFTYRWKPNMDINAAYDLNYNKYAFGSPMATSMRGHMGTDVSRTDIFHAVTVGVAKAF